jgi:two-component system LytT family sensor kinase
MKTGKATITRELSRNKWIYLGFWILVTIIFLYDTRYLITKAGLPYFVVCAVVRIGLLIGVAWTNLNFLMPRYLFSKRYASYFSLVLLLITGYLIIQSLYDYYLFGFIIGPNKGGQLSASLLYNFTHTSLYLLLTVALKFSIDWYEQKKLMQEIRVEKLQTEVNYLRSQVNPHFLFNALNNLYALTIKKSDQAPNIVLKLSELMEYMLYESDADVVPLEREINYLRNYLDLEKIRQGNGADIQLIVKGDANRCQIPPFLILPVVENAIKHGISKTLHNAYLYINIEITDRLYVTVVNNKLNFQKTDANGGIGLVNLKKRLELLYPKKHALEITDSSIQHEVRLKIDLLC